MVESRKEVGGWFRFLQRFQRHPGIQVCSPESAELLWIPFCRSITYRVHSGFWGADSGIRAAGRQQMVAGRFNIAQGGDGGSCRAPRLTNEFLWKWDPMESNGIHEESNVFLWNPLCSPACLGTPRISRDLMEFMHFQPTPCWTLGFLPRNGFFVNSSAFFIL